MSKKQESKTPTDVDKAMEPVNEMGDKFGGILNTLGSFRASDYYAAKSGPLAWKGSE